MLCPNCGAEIAQEAEFCSACGASLVSATPPPLAPPVSSLPVPVETRTSGMAIATLILGIASIFTAGLTGLPAIVCGIIALVQINGNKQLKGIGLAIAGMVLPLVVLVLVLPLALIAIPRLMGAGLKAKEATLKANLHQMRTAVDQFYMDTGAYPASLEDLVAQTEPARGIDSTGGAVTILAGSYKGPYLSPQGGIDNSGIPINPFGPDLTGNLAADIPAHWTYANGKVRAAVPASGNTLDGVPYQSL